MDRLGGVQVTCILEGRHVATLHVPMDASLLWLTDALELHVGQPVSFEYIDNEGDHIVVCNDEDMREMFGLYAWLEQKSPSRRIEPLQLVLRTSSRSRAPSRNAPSLTIDVVSEVHLDRGAYAAPAAHLTDGNFAVRYEDLRNIGIIGHGHGGTVQKALHMPTGRMIAVKSVPLDLTPDAQRQIMKELEVMERCHCEYIVAFHGAFFCDSHFLLAMELMDIGSLEYVASVVRRIPEPVLGKLVVAVVSGLVYLYERLKIVHRDVKPSNMLLNSAGQFKLCDFGVSGELVDSIAKTFVGTNAYMAPERVLGGAYSVRSDVWSLGVALVELATGGFPFRAGRLSAESNVPTAFELLECIVTEPPPALSTDEYSEALVQFVAECLTKDHETRPTPVLLQQHTFYRHYEERRVDVPQWIHSIVQVVPKP